MTNELLHSSECLCLRKSTKKCVQTLAHEFHSELATGYDIRSGPYICIIP